ncbi:CsgG/HfaB family protein [Autumnicola musiva]|uniref:CsgG/HfaB family protein n=1 Tax=Autumnicola musiva TaxID=3075589 RepID=A0ABU3D3B8_9FLAO|nr:CsgG/HfaB family protein [Zunongwangia sp. F117]MDT0675889.1 CsgG/HfaB family protein [Zunongwangia sp. F117]
MKLFKLLVLFSVLCLSVQLNAQKEPKVTMEEIEEQCQGIDLGQKITLSVSSFNVATPTAYAKFGDELSQMLTSALQNVNCFNVLLSVKDKDEILDEIAFGESGNVKAGSAVARGSMKGAQVVVMGKVTEYAAGESSGGAFGIKMSSNKAHIGFIIQLINPTTREIIDSESFNVDGRAGGFKGLSVLGIQTVGGTANNKALADACEKGIIQAVEYIVSERDKMPLPDLNPVNAANGTYITILNSDYGKFKTITDALAVKGDILEKNITDGTGSCFVAHAQSSYDIADYLSTTLGSTCSIQSVSEDEITIDASPER